MKRKQLRKYTIFQMMNIGTPARCAWLKYRTYGIRMDQFTERRTPRNKLQRVRDFDETR